MLLNERDGDVWVTVEFVVELLWLEHFRDGEERRRLRVGVLLFGYFESFAVCLNVNDLFLSEITRSGSHLSAFVAENAQVELKGQLVREVEHERWPDCAFASVCELADGNSLLLGLLDDPLERDFIFDFVGHDLCHLVQLFFVIEILWRQIVKPFELDGVALVMGFFLLTFNPVFVKVWVVRPGFGHLKQASDAFEVDWLTVSQVNSALMLQDAHGVTVRRVKVIAKELLELDCLVEFG